MMDARDPVMDVWMSLHMKLGGGQTEFYAVQQLFNAGVDLREAQRFVAAYAWEGGNAELLASAIPPQIVVPSDLESEQHIIRNSDPPGTDPAGPVVDKWEDSEEHPVELERRHPGDALEEDTKPHIPFVYNLEFQPLSTKAGEFVSCVAFASPAEPPPSDAGASSSASSASSASSPPQLCEMLASYPMQILCRVDKARGVAAEDQV